MKDEKESSTIQQPSQQHTTQDNREDPMQSANDLSRRDQYEGRMHNGETGGIPNENVPSPSQQKQQDHGQE
jgi:hypothetical protein